MLRVGRSTVRCESVVAKRDAPVIDAMRELSGQYPRFGYHRSMKNVVKLEHYYFPWELEKAISEWVHHYNHERYHESLDNVTPADVFEGRRNDILDQRALAKATTMTKRKVHNLQLAG